MQSEAPCEIRFIDGSEWEDAMDLAYRTFLKFDAVTYSAEGITHFREFISDNSLKRMFDAGSYQVIGAYMEGKMVGVISLRDNAHISLLFVDKDFQNRGVGRSLISALADYAGNKLHQNVLTVNAAPYAVGFYHKLGFRDTSEELARDGITFTPMKYSIDML